MTRLFVGLFPDEAVLAAVDAALAGMPSAPGQWRAVARERRHVTLRFHADAEPDEVVVALRRRLAGVPAPTLRCVGAGVFGTALWLGVRAEGGGPGWEDLLRAAGTDPAGHRAHLTVARARGRVPPVPPGLPGHRGPAWTVGEVALVASGQPYRVLERFPLVGGTGGGQAVGPAR